LAKSVHSTEYREFLRRLVAARHAAGLSQVEVARALRIPQSQVSRCESGERRVDVIELKRFAALYRRRISCFVP
jgi:transcriptional regulator with XRE-family HTH domain